jgi:probable rRNA maturation factor
MTASNFSLTNTTKGKLPSLPFVRMKDAVLGADYELSLAFVGDVRSRRLNKTYRDKTYTPNILSFPLDKKSGEMFINPNVARKQCSAFGRTYPNYVAFLFIHGLVHLKGFTHGGRMERTEAKFRKQFGI